MYKRKVCGQIFGLFKCIYVIDRPLGQIMIKQKLSYNGCNTVTSSRSTNYIRKCWLTVFPIQIQKCRKSNFCFPGSKAIWTLIYPFYFGCTQLWCLNERFGKLFSVTKISISERSVDIIGELKLIEKTALCVIFLV